MGSHRSSRRAAGALRETALSTLEENARDEPAGSPPDQPRTQAPGKTTACSFRVGRRRFSLPGCFFAAPRRTLRTRQQRSRPRPSNAGRARRGSPARIGRQRSEASPRGRCTPSWISAAWTRAGRIPIRSRCSRAPQSNASSISRWPHLRRAVPKRLKGGPDSRAPTPPIAIWTSSQPHEVARLIERTGDPVAAPSDGMIAQDRRAMARAGSFERRRATESPVIAGRWWGGR